MNKLSETYSTASVPMQFLADDERPREKALKNGISSLSDHELMAIIFGTGVHGKSVLDLCRDILNDHNGHLSMIAAMSTQDFIKQYRGIGPAKALTLLAGLELGRRAVKDAASMPQQQINTAEMAYALMRDKLGSLDHEEFHTLMMDNAAHVISIEFIASGGQTATVVDVRMVIRRALEQRATRMILFHNHPSGNLRPSMQDDAITSKIHDAAKLFDIRLDDHLIVSDRGFYSYHNQGKL